MSIIKSKFKKMIGFTSILLKSPIQNYYRCSILLAFFILSVSFMPANYCGDIASQFIASSENVDPVSPWSNIPASITPVFWYLIFQKAETVAIHKRKGILRYIQSNPGCIVSEIIKIQKIPRGTIRYHINHLEKEGAIVLKKIGKYMRIFPINPQIKDREKLLMACLRNDNSKKIICTLLHNESTTNKELSEKHSMNKSLTHRYLKEFVRKKIILVREEGKIKHYYMEPEIKLLIAKLQNYKL